MKCFVPLRILSRKFSLLLLLGLSVLADIKFYLKNSVTVSSPVLRDVAKIDGDTQLSNFLGSIKIGQRYLNDGLFTKDELKQVLKKHYIDSTQITVYGGPVHLYKRGENITRKELQNIVRSYVENRYPAFVIESISIPTKVVTVPQKSYRAVVKERSKTFRHLYLVLELSSNGSVFKSIPVTVKVTQQIAAAFAKRDIPKGKVITPDDVEIRKIRRYNSLQESIDLQNLYGSVAKWTIHHGQQIRRSAYEPNYAVKKRSSVKILYDKRGIRIELMGLALENGQKGDIIKVRNLSSNKVLLCKVLSAGSVLFVQ